MLGRVVRTVFVVVLGAAVTWAGLVYFFGDGTLSPDRLWEEIQAFVDGLGARGVERREIALDAR